MVDLTTEMGQLLGGLVRQLGDRGCVIQFVSPCSGYGVSTIAREFSRVAAASTTRPVWLVDADLQQQTQMAEIHRQPERFGRLSRAARASPDGSMFFAMHPPMRNREAGPAGDSKYLSARAALGGRLWVTQLRHDPMDWAHAPRISPEAAYWDALRRHAGWVCVDSPAGDRASTAIQLAPYMDATVIVIAADEADANDVRALRENLTAAGGRIAGVVLNKISHTESANWSARRRG